jgi:hypothetical protein
MKLNPIKANMTEIQTEQYIILMSYQTPVAYKHLTPEGMTYYKTNKKWSNTTTRHINSWLPYPQAEFGVEAVDQEVLDNLLNEVK